MSEIEVPKGWELTSLNDLVLKGSDKFTDGPFGSRLKVSDYTKSGYPIIRLQNIAIGKFIDKNWRFTSEKKFTELIRHSANAGDIIMAKMADPVARAAIITSIYDKYLISADCIKLKINDKKVLAKYLVYAINSPFVRSQAEKKSRGVTRLRINLSEVKKLLIPLPSIETQKKIVEKLDYVLGSLEEKKKEIVNRINKFDSKKIHSAYQNHLLNLAFSGKLTCEKFVESEDDPIPKYWDLEKLDDVCEKITSGGTPSRSNPEYFDGDIPWVKIGDLNNGIISKSDEKISKSGLENSSAKLFPKDTVLFGMYGGQSYSSGITGITKIKCATNQAICGMICGEKLNPYFLLYFLQRKVDEIRKMAEGAAQLNINQNKIKNIQIPIPPLETQKKIVEILDKKFQDWEIYKPQIENVEKQYQYIKKSIENIANSILNSAFSGKLVN